MRAMYHKFFLIYNNKSSLDLNLKIPKRPSIPLPKRQYNETPIEGRDGSLIEDLETYEDIKIPVNFNFIDRINMNDSARKVMLWLSNIEDDSLSFTDDLDFYYRVKKIEYTDIERQIKVKGTFTITFVCEPFRYYRRNDIITIEASPFNLYAPDFNYSSKPLMKVYGSGDITLTINNEDVLLFDISDHIIIDSVLEEAYSDTFENLNNKMKGEFPKLTSSINSIDWIGNITNIEITPNWRSL